MSTRSWIVAAALLVIAPPATAATPLDNLLSRVQSAGQRTQTLQASFVQRKRMPMFTSELRTSGRLSFARPDRLRWETFSPDASVLVLRGERAELRMPGESPRPLELRAGTALASLVEQMLFWFGLRPAATLQKHYQVSLRGTDAAPQLHLVPKDAALRKRIGSMDVWLDKELAPRHLQLDSAEGEVTRIEFGPIQRNLKLADSLFR